MMMLQRITSRLKSNVSFYKYLIHHIDESPERIVRRLTRINDRLGAWYGVTIDDFASILDMGCGRLMPNARVIRNYGKKIYALDSQYVYESGDLKHWMCSLRFNGLRSFARDFLLDLQRRRDRLQAEINEITGKSNSNEIVTFRNSVALLTI